jgi:PAS domain-containing protein
MAAAGDIARRLLDHHMDMNDASRPRMPRIKDLTLFGPVGVLSSRCTIAAGRIRALTAPPPITPTSPRCPSAWQPNPGRPSTYRRGNSVQTTGATSEYMSRSANTIRLRDSNAASNTSFARQLRETLNAVPTHAWYATPSGTLIFLNEKAADYGGLPKDHPLRLGLGTGAPWDAYIRFLHPDDRDETRRVWSNCLRTATAGEVSFRVRNAHGSYRWFVSRAEPTRANDGT